MNVKICLNWHTGRKAGKQTCASAPEFLKDNSKLLSAKVRDRLIRSGYEGIKDTA